MSTIESSSLTAVPITPRFGVELRDVTLVELSDDEVEALQQLGAERGVIVVRDQPMTMDQQVEFARRLGPLSTRPTDGSAAGDSSNDTATVPPELLAIHADETTRRAAGGTWHSDISSERETPALSMLRMEIVPESGGDTLFADMYQAYESLSAPVQSLVRGLTARHDPRGHYLYLSGIKSLKELPSQIHPVVRTHPRTGRDALFVNDGFVGRIMETNKREGDAILRMLYEHVAFGVEFHCRVRWEPNTVVFWDNRCVQHHAAFDYFPAVRHGYRATAMGEQPYLAS